MIAVTKLAAECAAEIAALPRFENLDAAVLAINGQGGQREGVRAKYLRRLHAAARSQKLSDVLVSNVGAAIALQCDRAVALCAQIADANHGSGGWTSAPINCLTQAERDALGRSVEHSSTGVLSKHTI